MKVRKVGNIVMVPGICGKCIGYDDFKAYKRYGDKAVRDMDMVKIIKNTARYRCDHYAPRWTWKEYGKHVESIEKHFGCTCRCSECKGCNNRHK